jgi:hypothetical protein
MARPPNTECPAIRTLHSLFTKELPTISVGTWRAGSNQRVQENGKTVVKFLPDRHTAGLAIDIMLDSRDDDEKALADALIDAFIKIHSQMQWYDMIYVDWPTEDQPRFFHIPGNPLYSGEKLKKVNTDTDTGMAHRNHIHLDWCDYTNKASDPADVYNWPTESKNIAFEAALRAEFQSIRALFNPQVTPSWLQGWWEFKWRGAKYFYYFDKLSKAAWSQTKPQDKSSPLQNEEGRGVVAIDELTNGITIRWTNTGSIEKLVRTKGAPPGQVDKLAGTWNDAEPLEGAKMR